jgi:membrane protein YqaA with SNARE-associated domain
MVAADQISGWRRGRSERAAAAVWGFAEATLFFLVPDILLTWIAVGSLRRSVVACCYTVVGALVGGCVMYVWSVKNAPGALSAVEGVPAISPAMIDGVRRSLAEDGLTAVLFGPVAGTPYKVYAVQAGALGLPLWKFLLVSVPARGLRFVGLSLAAAAISAAIGSRLDPRWKRAIHLSAWAAFYTWYFAVTPG